MKSLISKISLIKLSLVSLVYLSSTAQAQTMPTIKQETVASFPKVGRVRVQVVEQYEQLPKLVFTKIASGETIATIPAIVDDESRDAFMPSPMLEFTNPFMRFKILHLCGIQSPLIFAVAVRPGGSDTLFEAMVIGEFNGQIKSLTQSPIAVNEQGGIYVGNLRKGLGVGVVKWNFIWKEPKSAPHHYAIKVLRFDRKKQLFVESKMLESKRKYLNGKNALSELGLPRYTNLLDTIEKDAEQ